MLDILTNLFRNMTVLDIIMIMWRSTETFKPTLS